jgi:hypothetical protein
MPRGKKNEKAAEIQETAAEFNVFDNNDVLKRTFTVEKHGEKAGELAESFANKFGFKVK